MKKLNKCRLCGWGGVTHLHHIIPRRDYGEDIDKNIIELCPNHHSEACLDEYSFIDKYKLRGVAFSSKKMEVLKLASFLYSKSIFHNLDYKEQDFLTFATGAYNFDSYDFIAVLLGTTRGTIEKSILKMEF